MTQPKTILLRPVVGAQGGLGASACVRGEAGKRPDPLEQAGTLVHGIAAEGLVSC